MKFIQVLWVGVALTSPTFADDLSGMAQSLERSIWGWTTADSLCVDRVRRFDFNSDLTEMKNFLSGHDEPSVYELLAYKKGSITMQIYGEERLDPDGNPVIWELVFKGPDTFCWHRLDWPEGACTPDLVRCMPQPLGVLGCLCKQDQLLRKGMFLSVSVWRTLRRTVGVFPQVAQAFFANQRRFKKDAAHFALHIGQIMMAARRDYNAVAG